MLPMSARIWAALVEAEDLRKEIVRGSAVFGAVVGAAEEMDLEENHRKTIGKWWFNGILMGFNGILMGINYNDLTVLPNPGNIWKSWLDCGESSPFMAEVFR